MKFFYFEPKDAIEEKIANKTRYNAACNKSEGVKSQFSLAILLIKANVNAAAETQPEILPARE